MTEPMRRDRGRRRLIVHGRRMLGAMLCWTALQSVAAELDDGRARAEAQRLGEERAATP